MIRAATAIFLTKKARVKQSATLGFIALSLTAKDG